MGRKWMLLAATLVIAILMLALGPDDFVIGTYSHFRKTECTVLGGTANSSQWPVYAGELADLMREAGYNTMLEISYGNLSTYVSQWQAFQDHGIIPVVYDELVTIPSYFNDGEFQAEYLDPGLPPTGMMPSVNCSDGTRHLKTYPSRSQELR